MKPTQKNLKMLRNALAEHQMILGFVNNCYVATFNGHTILSGDLQEISDQLALYNRGSY